MDMPMIPPEAKMREYCESHSTTGFASLWCKGTLFLTPGGMNGGGYTAGITPRAQGVAGQKIPVPTPIIRVRRVQKAFTR